jgi:hypothetical protein
MRTYTKLSGMLQVFSSRLSACWSWQLPFPKGALSFNPKLLSDEDLDHDLHDEGEEDIDIFDMGSGSVDGSIMAKDPVIRKSEGDARTVSRRHDKD